MVEYRKAPQKPRTGYHIFLRLESDRLRKVLGESATTQNLREMANAAWRRFSDKDKLVYLPFSPACDDLQTLYIIYSSRIAIV